jgi:hypothetical protein
MGAAEVTYSKMNSELPLRRDRTGSPGGVVAQAAEPGTVVGLEARKDWLARGGMWGSRGEVQG